jgi:hypothetical protein
VSMLTALFILALLVAIVALVVVYSVTELDTSRSPAPSPWQYGIGARHAPQHLPPISRAATSVPAGSDEASHWPGCNAERNRHPHRHG